MWEVPQTLKGRGNDDDERQTVKGRGNGGDERQTVKCRGNGGDERQALKDITTHIRAGQPSLPRENRVWRIM